MESQIISQQWGSLREKTVQSPQRLINWEDPGPQKERGMGYELEGGLKSV